MEKVFYKIPDESSKCCSMSEYFTGNNTKHACFMVSFFYDNDVIEHML